MSLLNLNPSRSEMPRPRIDGVDMAIQCRNVGIRYSGDSQREDVKSRVNNWVRRREGAEPIWGLRGLDLSVASGEILGVVGRNGAGKSTLCRLLTGILRPDEGNVTINGDVAALLTFGTGFDLRLSGRENIYRNAMMLGMSRRQVDERYDEIVEFAGVGKFIEQSMKTYSTGMRSRLGFSVAAFMEPEILLLDEALSVGDLEFYERASAKLKEIIARCRLVVMVTHRMEFVEEVCTRAVWIDKGKAAAYGLPSDVVAAYRHTFPKPQPAPKKVTAELKKTRSEVGTRNVIVTENIGVRYRIGGRGEHKYHWALRGVSMSVREGDILGVIGPNGTGKTTLCRVIAGMLHPDEGRAHVEGDVSALITFGTGFNPQLSGRDNIYLNGMMLGMPRKRIHSVIDQIIDFAGIRKRIDDPIKTYSSGMRSRLGFSVAATLEPSVFVIDEALNAGDADFYSKASAKIQELITQAHAVVVVTHNLAFVERVCTRALWLHRGQLLFDGDPCEAVSRYRDTVHRKIDPHEAAARQAKSVAAPE